MLFIQRHAGKTFVPFDTYDTPRSTIHKLEMATDTTAQGSATATSPQKAPTPQLSPNDSKALSPRRMRLVKILHTLVLIASMGLIVLISWDSFNNISFLASEQYMKIQFWICMFFIFDIVAEFFIYPRKWHYVLTHIFFLLVSIPYINIIAYYDIALNPEMQYLIRFVPMIRAGYVLALVLGVLFSNKISGLFATYLGLLIATVYFASLMFFIEEHYINPGVRTYWSALWWAFMDVTTVGCNINCITPTGKVLGVILAAEGLILFPIFTVYITNSLSQRTVRDAADDKRNAAKRAKEKAEKSATIS